jgi:hypothetical protein
MYTKLPTRGIGGYLLMNRDTDLRRTKITHPFQHSEQLRLICAPEP